ncbi:YggT family protein [Clostridiales bacterium COT073_COT-073]|nr:YggT family protein [Clostridiales bacterium COT073_COT-073]
MKLIVTTISWFLTALEISLFARAILSWLPGGTSSIQMIRKFLFDLTEPILQPIRQLIERSIFQGNGNIFDISPLVAFIMIDAIKAILHNAI